MIKRLIDRTLYFPLPPKAMLWFTLFVNIMSYVGKYVFPGILSSELKLTYVIQQVLLFGLLSAYTRV